jgi:integrase
MGRRSFGMIDKLPSGNFRARYTGPDGKRHQAPAPFALKTEAGNWLAEQQSTIARGQWVPPELVKARLDAEAAALAKASAAETAKRITLGDYAQTWLAERTNSKGELLRVRTREEYERLLAGPLADLLEVAIGDLRASQVRKWRADQLARGTKTQTARAYALLASIMKTAVADKLADETPCTVRGGTKTSTGIKVLPPTDAELETILETIRPCYRAMVVAAAIGGLRYGEVIRLQAKNVMVERDDEGGVVAVRLAVNEQVVWTKHNGAQVGEVKAVESVRTIAIFGSDALIIAEHVHGLIGNALLFPAPDGANYLHPTTFHRWWKKARSAAGRDDLHFHALRHYAGTAYAQAGATVKETMARLGHSTTSAAMRYQHAGNRDDELAARLVRWTKG